MPSVAGELIRGKPKENCKNPELKNHGCVLKHCPAPGSQSVADADEDHYSYGQAVGGKPGGTYTLRQDVAFQRGCGESNRTCESGNQRNPAGDESEKGMSGPGQKQIFTARLGHRSRELTVADSSGECDEASDDPRSDNQPGSAKFLERESRRRENAGSDHAGDHQEGQCPKAESFPCGHRFNASQNAESSSRLTL